MDKSPDPTDKHVGNRMRMRRLMLDLSQTQLADALGLSFQQVQKYEKGTNRISASRLEQMARLLQVPIAFFFEGLPSHSKGKKSQSYPPYVSDFLSTSDGLSLVKGFMKIKDRKIQRCLIKFIEDIADTE